MPTAQIFRSIVIPPLVALPILAAQLAFLHKAENGTFFPGGNVSKFARFLRLICVMIICAHAVYGSIVYFVAQRMGLSSFQACVALYSAVPFVIALLGSRSRARARDGIMYTCDAVIVGSVGWYFVHPYLGVS
jgi:hypothetical protein